MDAYYYNCRDKVKQFLQENPEYNVWDDDEHKTRQFNMDQYKWVLCCTDPDPLCAFAAKNHIVIDSIWSKTGELYCSVIVAQGTINPNDTWVKMVYEDEMRMIELLEKTDEVQLDQMKALAETIFGTTTNVDVYQNPYNDRKIHVSCGHVLDGILPKDYVLSEYVDNYLGALVQIMARNGFAQRYCGKGKFKHKFQDVVQIKATFQC